MAALNPYLHFSGNTEHAFEFYRSVFGGEFTLLMKYKDAPLENKMGNDESENIMHISLPIGKGTILMGNDVPQMYGKVNMGTNFVISISVDSNEEADKLFNGLSAGGQVTMPLEKTFWSPYFGMLKDQFGVQWMVSQDSGVA